MTIYFLLKYSGEEQQVAYYAYLSLDVANLGASQLIKFDHVVTNQGNL